MENAELITLLKGRKAFFDGMPDVAEIVLYGSAMEEKEIAGDVDLLVIPSREMSESEKVDLRQKVWEELKGELPVPLEVQAPKEGLDKESLSARGVRMTSIYSK